MRYRYLKVIFAGYEQISNVIPISLPEFLFPSVVLFLRHLYHRTRQRSPEIKPWRGEGCCNCRLCGLPGFDTNQQQPQPKSHDAAHPSHLAFQFRRYRYGHVPHASGRSRGHALSEGSKPRLETLIRLRPNRPVQLFVGKLRIIYCDSYSHRVASTASQSTPHWPSSAAVIEADDQPNLCKCYCAVISEEAIEFQPGYRSLAQIVFFFPIFEEKKEGTYAERTCPTKLTNCCRRCCLIC